MCCLVRIRKIRVGETTRFQAIFAEESSGTETNSCPWLSPKGLNSCWIAPSREAAEHRPDWMAERVAAHAHPCASRHRYIRVHWDYSACRPRPFGVAVCAGAVSHRCAALGSNPGGFCRTTLHHTYQSPRKGGLWYVAAGAVCCEPVSAGFPDNGKYTGNFPYFISFLGQSLAISYCNYWHCLGFSHVP